MIQIIQIVVMQTERFGFICKSIEMLVSLIYTGYVWIQLKVCLSLSDLLALILDCEQEIFPRWFSLNECINEWVNSFGSNWGFIEINESIATI